MASEKITALVEEVKGLTVLELSELVHTLEDVFGVSAAAAAVAGPDVYKRQVQTYKQSAKSNPNNQCSNNQTNAAAISQSSENILQCSICQIHSSIFLEQKSQSMPQQLFPQSKLAIPYSDPSKKMHIVIHCTIAQTFLQ